MEGTSGYGDNGGFDTLDVTAGFIQDVFKNAATTDGASDALLLIGAPQLTVVKSSTVVSDPINGATNPLRIPGAVIEFTVIVFNNGNGSPDTDSVAPADNLDNSKLAYDVATGVTFTDVGGSSGPSLGTIVYSDDPSPGPYVYDYTPSPDGGGFDGDITSVKMPTTGRFSYGGIPAKSFTVKFRARIK